MKDNYYTGGGWKSLLRNVCFIVFGLSVFYNPFDPFNLFNLSVGALLCLLVGWLYKKFLRTFLSLANKEVKQRLGKGVIFIAVDNAMLYLIPFAVMVAVATYVLGWSVSTVFMSAGIMAVGTAAAIEIGKLLEKPKLINMIAASGVSFLFSYGLITLLVKASIVPVFIEGVISMVPSLLQGGVF